MTDITTPRPSQHPKPQQETRTLTIWIVSGALVGAGLAVLLQDPAVRDVFCRALRSPEVQKAGLDLADGAVHAMLR